MDFSFLTDTMLPRLLAASVQSTVVVAVVLLLCRLMPRLPAATRAALWWLVALQLLVGLVWSSPLALPLLPPAMAEAANLAPVPASRFDLQVASVGLADVRAMPVAGVEMPAVEPTAWSWINALALAWLLGLSWMMARTLRGLHQARQLLRKSRDCRDMALRGALRLASAAHGLAAPPRLRVSNAVQSPQLIGPWRPVLLLPSGYADSMSADELDMALTHELVHLQRRDLWWGLLPAAAQHLFFFHPLAHMAAREYALAREAACDAAVVAGHRHCAGDYGRLLVRLGVAPRPQAGLASASPNFHILRRRLTMLQDTASTPRALTLVIILSVAVLGVVPYRIVAAPLPPAPPSPPAPSTVPAAPATPAPIPDRGNRDRVAAPSAGSATATRRTAPAAAPEVSSTPVAAPAPLAAPTPVPAPTPPTPRAPGAVGLAPAAAPPAPAARVAPVPAAVPRVPPVTVRPPAAPTPPSRPAGRSSVVIHNGKKGPEAYVLLRGDHSVVLGSDEDLAEARRLSGNADVLLLRRGQDRYLVRDPATMARFGDAFEGLVELGKAQAQLGRRQGEIGRQQGEIGARQGMAGEAAAKLAAGQARHAAARDLERRSIVAVSVPDPEQMAALMARQRGLAEEMKRHGILQAGIAREQEALATKHRQTAEQAERQARAVADEAISRGLAAPVRN